MNKVVGRYIGDKNYYKTVLKVTVPIIIQNAITNFINLLDNLMVGRVGTDQMNAVAIVNQLLFVFILCCFGVISGAGIFTVQFYGKGDEEGVRNTFRAKLLFLFAALVIGVSIYSSAGSMLITKFLHQTDNIGNAEMTLAYAKDYLGIMLIGLLPFIFSMAYANTLRDVGETVAPMVASVTAVVVNLCLNYILIFGKFGAPELGVNGAAIATVVSRFVEAIINIIYTHSHSAKYPFMKGAYKSLHIPGSLIKQIFVKGTPLAVNESLWGIGMTMLNQCYSTRGLAVVGAISINSTISNLFNVVYFAIGESIAILVGRFLGAGKMEEAKEWARKTITFGVLCCLVFGSLLASVHDFFPSFYNTEDEVKQIASMLILVSASFMPLHSFLHSCYFTLRTGGKTVVTFLFDSVFLWVVAVPLALLLTRKTNLPILPIYICINMIDFLKALVGYILVKKGVWVQNIVKTL